MEGGGLENIGCLGYGESVGLLNAVSRRLDSKRRVPATD